MRTVERIRYRLAPRTGRWSLGSHKAKTLGARSGVALSSVITSRKCYYKTTATLTITTGTGELSKNGGAWGASVSIVPGDYVRARVTSSSSHETAVNITLSNGDTFGAITRAENTMLTSTEMLDTLEMVNDLEMI